MICVAATEDSRGPRPGAERGIGERKGGGGDGDEEMSRSAPANNCNASAAKVYAEVGLARVSEGGGGDGKLQVVPIDSGGSSLEPI